jgi:hypothetical protein
MSMALPAVRGTMTRIGCRVGHAWACDGVEFTLSKAASALAMSANAKNRQLFMLDLLPMPSERCTKSPSDNLCRVWPFLQTIAVAKFIARFAMRPSFAIQQHGIGFSMRL